jgi:hypothetical protein
MYQIDFTEDALRDFGRFSAVEQSDILLDLEELELDPFPIEVVPVQDPQSGDIYYLYQTPFYSIGYQVFEADKRILVFGIDRLFGSN